jgi:hypothetical protein
MTITEKQWQSILMNMLGLRSGSKSDDINSAASYAMDCGVKAQWPLPSKPENWDKLLSGTLTTMKGFKESEKRFLLIVSKSTGNSVEYEGCFPKCSVKPVKVWAHTSLDAEIEPLIKWVCSNIPEG